MIKKFKEEIKGGVTVITPPNLLHAVDVGTLDEQLYAHLGKGSKFIILDLGEVDWINSSGVAVLVHHYKKFRDVGGRLVLCNLTKNVESILVVAKLTSVFESYDSLDEAVASFLR